MTYLSLIRKFFLGYKDTVSVQKSVTYSYIWYLLQLQLKKIQA
jgi:hypothetical protein